MNTSGSSCYTRVGHMIKGVCMVAYLVLHEWFSDTSAHFIRHYLKVTTKREYLAMAKVGLHGCVYQDSCACLLVTRVATLVIVMIVEV